MKGEIVQTKRAWATPKLTVFGSVKEITQSGAKCKVLSLKDDFVVGIHTLHISPCPIT